MDLEKLQSLLTVKQVAELHEVAARVVRKEAKAGRVPGAIKVLGKHGFDPDLVADWTPPEPGKFGGRRTKREDGRQRYRIYLTKEEAVTLGDTYEISDPREAARKRRAERKAKAAAAEAGAESVAEDESDPFKEFGV